MTWINILILLAGLTLFILSSIQLKKVKKRILDAKKAEEISKEFQIKNKQIKEQNELLHSEVQQFTDQVQELIKIKEYNQKEVDKLEFQLRTLQNSIQQNCNMSQEAYQKYFEALEATYDLTNQEFDNKIILLNQAFTNNKKEAIKAFEKYIDLLDEKYSQSENDFDLKIQFLKLQFKECEEEINKIQETRKAALEAQKREEELLLQADFYKLHISDANANTIALIEELKPRLPDPRVLSMLIWTTYFQKQTTALCNNVLGTSIVCGIYKITNQKNGLCYIGQSTDIATRWKTHVKCGLGIDTPVQNKLYQAMKRDGITNFTFELLEKCDRNLLNEKEKFYIDLYQSYTYGYNSTQGNK